MINRLLLKSYKVRTSEKIQKMFDLSFRPIIFNDLNDAKEKSKTVKRLIIFNIVLNNKDVCFSVNQDTEFFTDDENKILSSDLDLKHNWLENGKIV